MALALGESEPTLCAGWTVKGLVVHLLVRERKPWAMARATAAYDGRDLDSLVTQLKAVPVALWLIDPILNGMEMFIHHEDIRRAQSSWAVRELAAGDERTLWLGVRMLARVQGRRLDVPLMVEAGKRRTVVVRGADPVVVSGPVSEILLLLAGRSAVRGLSYDGPPTGSRPSRPRRCPCRPRP